MGDLPQSGLVDHRAHSFPDVGAQQHAERLGEGPYHRLGERGIEVFEHLARKPGLATEDRFGPFASQLLIDAPHAGNVLAPAVQANLQREVTDSAVDNQTWPHVLNRVPRDNRVHSTESDGRVAHFLTQTLREGLEVLRVRFDSQAGPREAGQHVGLGPP